jgi:magnesium-transporting ATPase (P-type)
VAYRQWDTPPDEMNESVEEDLVLLGMVGIQDPARPEAREAVTTARQAGIRTIMITGDHALTGEAIARDLGILKEDERAVTGDQLNTMSDDEIRAALKETACFARVSPSHKLKLVKMLQEDGHIAAMTGDGVNDAPALKQADIGVAMGITGTDVSKGAAAMVLTDDNFASIVSAVEQGRAIYDNIRKFIKYLLSSNVGEILTMFVALLAGLKVPLLAIQILWINLVTDGLPAIALGFEPAEDDVMERRPRPRDESIFASGVGRHIVVIGMLIAAITLGGYIWGYSHNGLDPFSDTHGLETLSAERLQSFIDNTNQFSGERLTVPDGWNDMSEEARVDVLFADEPNAEGEGGLHAEGGGLVGLAERLPRTIAFTILAFTQMFEVMAIHSGDRVSFFRKGFSGNWLLLGAVVSTFLLQLAVIYIPFLQASFETSALTLTELAVCFAMASLILFAVEIEKLLNRRGLDTHEYVEDPEAVQHPAEA